MARTINVSTTSLHWAAFPRLAQSHRRHVFCICNKVKRTIVEPLHTHAMCQLCGVLAIVDRDRWPKPLEHHVSELKTSIHQAHRDVELFNEQQSGHDGQPQERRKSSIRVAPEALAKMTAEIILSVRTIVAQLELMETDREEWWKSKAQQRRDWEEGGQVHKTTHLQVINNRATDMIRDMQTKVGLFARWTLGVRDLDALD